MVEVKYVIAGLQHTSFYACYFFFVISTENSCEKLPSAPLAAQWLQVCSESVDEYFLSSNFQYYEIVEYDC